MKRLLNLTTLAVAALALLSVSTAQAQFPGDNVTLMFESNNSTGFNTFPGAREYPNVTSTFALTVGSVSGNFTTSNARNLQVVDSPFVPFNDGFQNAGGTLTLNDPNFNVHDALGEGMFMSYLFSDSTRTLVSTNILTNLIGNTYNAAAFDLALWDLSYTPDFMTPSEDMTIAFSSISFAAGSLPNLVKVTINGTVETNNITNPGTSLAIPEPATCAMLVSAGLMLVRRRR